MLCRFLVLLLHRVANMVHYSLNQHPLQHPLDLSRLSFGGVYHPTLLETWSRQRLVVNALRTRGCEPLRSASHLLGFTLSRLFLGSWPQACGGSY